MADDLTTTNAADGQRALAWKVLSLPPSMTTTIASLLGDEAPACIEAAIAKLDHDLRPVPDAGTGRAEWSTALDERIRRLAVKVLPTAKPADTAEWRTAMIDALSDLPAMVALTAAKRAIHRPFRFIGDIEAALREIAAEILVDRESRLTTLRRYRAEIAAALNPPPALPAPPPMEWSATEAERLNGVMRRMGCSTRWAADGTTYQEASAA